MINKKFTMSVDMSNAAFSEVKDDDRHPELARILRVTSSLIQEGHDAGTIWDINGNVVGKYAIFPIN